MWKSFVLLLCLSGYCLAGPVGTKRNMPIVQQRDDTAAVATSMEGLAESEQAAIPESEMMIMSTLTLPSNATSIRADITDGFSCENKTYGYYADVENDCQIFHVCLPVTYADGKENTFRWSFICPEETIFSQDSFTCMRPDDMTITCDESYQYYELNRNFGMVESEKEPAQTAQESDNKEPSETVEEAETQSEPVKPVVQEEEEKEAPKPVEQAVKVQKPNRRKPGVSYASQKKPVNSFPLRKMPQIQPVMPNIMATQDSEDNKEVETQMQEEEEEKEEIKPVVQKFSRRPAPAMANTIKDKIQNTKSESMNGIRTQLFNQNRKRPSMFNKKPVEQEAEEEKPVMESVQIVNQPESQQTFSHMESELSNTNAETQEADSAIQASETNEHIVKPEQTTEEESLKTEDVQAVEMPAENVEEPVQVLEAFEEIPAVIAEVMETQPAAAEEEETPKQEEQMPVIAAEEVQTPAEEEPAKEEEPMTVISAEETKTAAQEEEPKVEETMSVMTAEETQTAAEEEQTKVEEQQIPVIIAEETKISTEEEQQLTAEETQTTYEEDHIKEEEQQMPVMIAEQTPEALDTQLVVEEEKVEETKSVEIPQSQEETQANEETPEVQVVEKIEDSMASEETSSVNESQAVEETQFVSEPQAVEETQSVEENLTAEEPQPIVVKTAEESQMIEDNQIMNEAKPVDEQPEQFPASVETEQVKTETVAEPAIFENSEEGLAAAPVQTIEDMEAERPAEAPESMQATEEMSHPDPMVQQMFEDLEGNKQSMGGFKPVDPVMAHEAEQLIADFINTLRKNDFTNETPGMIMPQPHQETEQEQQPDEVVMSQEVPDNMENQDVKKEEETAQVSDMTKEEEQEVVKSNEAEEIKEESVETQPEKSEALAVSQESNAEEMVKEEAEEVKSETETMSEENTDNKELVALKSLEVHSSENVEEVPKSEEQQADSSNMMVNMPQDIYQIPVQVITAPVEEMPVVAAETEKKPLEMTATKPEDQLVEESAEPNMMQVAYKPLSIDDIVELVKERLDHMPKNEMETPMQLEQVLGDMQDDKPAGDEGTVKGEEEKVVETAQSEEDIVRPIYQRTVPVKVDAGVQTDNQEQDLNVEPSSETLDSVTDIKEKSNRSYRSRSMLTAKLDPRKRRFLFKADKFKSS